MPSSQAPTVEIGWCGWNREKGREIERVSYASADAFK